MSESEELDRRLILDEIEAFDDRIKFKFFASMLGGVAMESMSQMSNITITNTREWIVSTMLASYLAIKTLLDADSLQKKFHDHIHEYKIDHIPEIPSNDIRYAGLSLRVISYISGFKLSADLMNFYINGIDDAENTVFTHPFYTLSWLGLVAVLSTTKSEVNPIEKVLRTQDSS